MAALDQNYDGPEFNVTHSRMYDRVAVGSSALYYGQFYARARMYVTNIMVGVRSAASLAALTANIGHRASANAAFSVVAASTISWLSATSVGSYRTLALNRTLALGEFLGVKFTDAKGKYFISYEFQILPA